MWDSSNAKSYSDYFMSSDIRLRDSHESTVSTSTPGVQGPSIQPQPAMAARVLLRRRAAPLLATCAVLMVPTVAFAEAPPSAAPSHSQSNKKPIYDDLPIIPSTVPTSQPQSALARQTPAETAIAPSKPRGPTPTDRLAGQIKVARLWLHSKATATEDGVNNMLTRAFTLERSFTETVASLAPPRESGERLMPGAIYVLVAAMAGSVMTKNRGIILRASTPVVLGVFAAKAFVPVTTKNVGDLVWEWEKKIPPVADAHTSVTNGIDKAVHFSKVHANLGRNWVEDNVSTAREIVEGWIKKGK
ncbi:hypothetical protein MKZ38_006187 [Zalerion maritima]|uniref:MICOS complex subunit n=1 Tax=Zalerion maritima TaxID=339359 RepID=A0AAD5WQG3_9PEZI|nr:hypothetical protein MKZ38_006187 [Zalerion maritima]